MPVPKRRHHPLKGKMTAEGILRYLAPAVTLQSPEQLPMMGLHKMKTP
jgi:hypothetical protein